VTDPIASAATQVETAVEADVTTEVTNVESGVESEFVRIEADFAKAHAIAVKFSIASISLVVGWILGKVF